MDSLSSWSALALVFAAAAHAQEPPGMGSQPGDLDGGTPVESAQRCRDCHDRDATALATLYMPFDGWVSSMMANSARDPLFRATLTVANQDVPGIGQWCLRCHAPQSYVRGHSLPADGGALDEVDLEGVTCDACHRSIVPANVPQAPFIGNAQLYWEKGIFKHGPYENVSSPAHEGAQSTFTGSSEMCGQCHQVTNPFNGVPLQTTYEEWKNSAYSQGPNQKGCVDCHMPRLGSPALVAKFGNDRPNPRRHTLVGGNVWSLDVTLAANPDLQAYAEQFAETRRASLEILKAAAKLELDVPAGPVRPGDKVPVRVRVHNLAGHKLPTGYEDARRVFLQLQVGDAVVSGAYDADAGTLSPDARVYELVMGRGGVREDHIALHDMVVKDSRIPPAGFRATAATRPVGVDWFDLPDGGHRDFDEVTFEVTVPPGQSSVPVMARLFHQVTTRAYVEFLERENRTDDTGRTLKALYEATGRAAPEEMIRAESSLSVELPPPEQPKRGCTCQALDGPAALVLALLLRRARRSVQPLAHARPPAQS